MTEEPLEKEALQRAYEELRPKYKQLEDSLKRDLDTSLRKAGIKVLSIESRIKEFDSFWDKVQRKAYDDPLEEMQDICGLRIICYYPADVETVCELIEDNLDVIESVDKAESQKPEEFGYLSRHFIVIPKDHWLGTPSSDGLDGLTAEIQVRTIFQHAWAELSHELSYKREDHVPQQFRRKLFQLSAMLENLDDQFNELHQRKGTYAREVSEEARATGEFDVSQELNIDTLQAFLDFHFPQTPPSESQMTDFLGALLWNGITLQGLQAAYDRIGGAEEILRLASLSPIPQIELTQPILGDIMLDFANDDWWRSRARMGRYGPYRSWVAKTRQSLKGRTP